MFSFVLSGCTTPTGSNLSQSLTAHDSQHYSQMCADKKKNKHLTHSYTIMWETHCGWRVEKNLHFNCLARKMASLSSYIVMSKTLSGISNVLKLALGLGNFTYKCPWPMHVLWTSSKPVLWYHRTKHYLLFVHLQEKAFCLNTLHVLDCKIMWLIWSFIKKILKALMWPFSPPVVLYKAMWPLFDLYNGINAAYLYFSMCLQIFSFEQPTNYVCFLMSFCKVTP